MHIKKWLKLANQLDNAALYDVASIIDHFIKAAGKTQQEKLRELQKLFLDQEIDKPRFNSKQEEIEYLERLLKRRQAREEAEARVVERIDFEPDMHTVMPQATMYTGEIVKEPDGLYACYLIDVTAGAGLDRPKGPDGKAIRYKTQKEASDALKKWHAQAVKSDEQRSDKDLTHVLNAKLKCTQCKKPLGKNSKRGYNTDLSDQWDDPTKDSWFCSPECYKKWQHKTWKGFIP